jgi:hexokinase
VYNNVYLRQWHLIFLRINIPIVVFLSSIISMFCFSGKQTFEKMISGMYMGELTRQVINFNQN